MPTTAPTARLSGGGVGSAGSVSSGSNTNAACAIVPRPSATTWCSCISTAIRPGAKPVITTARHIGRSRGSGVAWISAISASRLPPSRSRSGTCQSQSRSPAGTQRGCRQREGIESRCRKRGISASCSRSAAASRSRYAEGSTPLSITTSPPTCCGAAGDST